MLKDKMKYHWGVIVDESLSKDGEIYLNSDSVAIEDGNLVFYTEQNCKVVFCISKGLWKAYFASSCIDGAACVVDYWKREEDEKN